MLGSVPPVAHVLPHWPGAGTGRGVASEADGSLTLVAHCLEGLVEGAVALHELAVTWQSHSRGRSGSTITGFLGGSAGLLPLRSPGRASVLPGAWPQSSSELRWPHPGSLCSQPLTPLPPFLSSVARTCLPLPLGTTSQWEGYFGMSLPAGLNPSSEVR